MDEKWMKTIRQYFDGHQEEYVRDLAKLVEINSEREKAEAGRPFGSGPAEVLASMLELAASYGFEGHNLDNYAGYVQYPEASGGRKLDILAHLDAVPAGEGWSATEPFTLLQQGDFLYGRGTADDKGPALTALYALRCIRDCGIPLQQPVRLVFGTDEECGSSDMEYYFRKEGYAGFTFTPDADFPLINIEKGHFTGTLTAETESAGPGRAHVVSLEGGMKTNVIPGRASAVIEGLAPEVVRRAAEPAAGEYGVAFTVEGESPVSIFARGQQAHAAYPEGGQNAVTALLALVSRLPLADTPGFRRIQSLSALFPHGDWLGEAAGIARSDPESGDLTVSLTIVHIDERSLQARFDCRSCLSATEESLSVVGKRAASAGISLKASLMPPHVVDGNSPFVQTLLACYEAYSGEKGRCLSIGGGTYVHDVENGVAFGCRMPGIENNMHGADEKASLKVLMMSGMIFAQAIAEICG